jgi:hypothetical protein
MSLNYDYTKCKKPENQNERVAINTLTFATILVGLNQITAKNAAEFYARLSFIEKLRGPLRINTTPGAPALFFTPAEVQRWVGLKTNATPLTRSQFLLRFSGFLDGMVTEYKTPPKRLIVGYAGPSEHGTYPSHKAGCVCGLCESTPANR